MRNIEETKHNSLVVQLSFNNQESKLKNINRKI